MIFSKCQKWGITIAGRLVFYFFFTFPELRESIAELSTEQNMADVHLNFKLTFALLVHLLSHHDLRGPELI